MDRKSKNPALPPLADGKTKERKAKETLARPPKDRREVTIGPTNGVGPDVNVE